MHADFTPLIPYQTLLQNFSGDWGFGGGWAIDLFIGRATRPHSDVDIVIWREDQHQLRHPFPEWDWFVCENQIERPWPATEFLELPIHSTHAHDKDGRVLEVLMLEKSADHWVFRRDPKVTMAAKKAFVDTQSGLSVLNPAIALLFKSKRLDAKDIADFNAVQPVLTTPDRIWLKNALAVTDAQHIWINQL